MKRSVIVFALLLAHAGGVLAEEVATRDFGTGAAVTGGGVLTREIAVRNPSAGLTPLAVSFVPVAELPSGDWSVAGLRLNLLVGRHRDVWGVDIGVIGSDVTCDGGGLQTAGIFSRCGGDFQGVQMSGVINWTDGEIGGVQVALVNHVSELSGLQLGFLNVADRGSGVQIGIVNAARALDGLQIGLVNVIRESPVPFFPIANFAF